MEALMPKLFILSAEASIVLFLIVIIILILKNKAKRKDIHASREMVSHYINRSDERISNLKKQLQDIGFNGDADAQAEKLYDQEKSLIKEFVSLYLQHDTSRLLDYSKNISNIDDIFLNISGTPDSEKPAEPLKDTAEENANATQLAREQMESNDEQLKELSELRLKNTELNEHLFEALETVTELLTEHGKKTGQEINTNSQKILEAIIYLRDKRLGNEENATLDNITIIKRKINDNLETDLNTLIEPIETELPAEDNEPEIEALSEQTEAEAEAELNFATETMMTSDTSEDEINLQDALDTETSEAEIIVDDDPWAEALSELDTAEADVQAEPIETDIIDQEVDPWADALAEQAAAETSSEDEDPWAEALAEQAVAEVEEDPWADALAKQNDTKNKI